MELVFLCPDSLNSFQFLTVGLNLEFSFVEPEHNELLQGLQRNQDSLAMAQPSGVDDEVCLLYVTKLDICVRLDELGLALVKLTIPSSFFLGYTLTLL